MISINDQANVKKFEGYVIAYQEEGETFDNTDTFTLENSSNLYFGVVYKCISTLPHSFRLKNFVDHCFRISSFVLPECLGFSIPCLKDGLILKMRAATSSEVKKLQEAIHLNRACIDIDNLETSPQKSELNWEKLSSLAQHYFAKQILFTFGANDRSSLINCLPKEIVAHILNYKNKLGVE